MSGETRLKAQEAKRGLERRNRGLRSQSEPLPPPLGPSGPLPASPGGRDVAPSTPGMFAACHTGQEPGGQERAH